VRELVVWDGIEPSTSRAYQHSMPTGARSSGSGSFCFVEPAAIHGFQMKPVRGYPPGAVVRSCRGWRSDECEPRRRAAPRRAQPGPLAFAAHPGLLRALTPRSGRGFTSSSPKVEVRNSTMASPQVWRHFQTYRSRPFRRHQPKLCQRPPEGVDELSALPDQALVRPERHRAALDLGTFHGNEPHGRARGGLSDGLASALSFGGKRFTGSFCFPPHSGV